MNKVATIPELKSVWPDGAAFLAHVRTREGETSFVYLSSDARALPPEHGTGVLFSVSLHFSDRGADFRVHGRVVPRDEADPHGCLRLAFLPEEKQRQELVLVYAEGESVPYLRRKAVRTPCVLPITVTLDSGTTLEGFSINLSERGASIAVSSLVTDQRIELAITLPGSRQRLRVMGRVTSAVQGPAPGVGVEFLFASARQRDEVAAEVARIRAGQS